MLKSVTPTTIRPRITRRDCETVLSKEKTSNITYQTKAGHGRRGGVARPLGPMIGALGKRAFGRRGFAGGEIITGWSRVVGENLAKLSAPERIVYPRGKRSGGTLYLRIETGSIAVELQHLEPVLLERINAYFGYKAVERVRLTQAPLNRMDKPRATRDIGPDPEKLSEITNTLIDVKDPELKQALNRLAKAILRREGRRSGT